MVLGPFQSLVAYTCGPIDSNLTVQQFVPNYFKADLLIGDLLLNRDVCIFASMPLL